MKDHRVDLFEIWNLLDTSIDVSVAFVSKKKGYEVEKVGKDYKSFPTYYPIIYRIKIVALEIRI